MSRIAAYAAISICLAVAAISCVKKKDDPSSASKSALLVGTFRLYKVEVSNTNSGSDWKDMTSSSQTGNLTFNSDGTYVERVGYTVSGSWEIPLNGSTLIKGSESFAIATLDAHSLVLVEHLEPTGGLAGDGKYYKWWRYSYSR